MSANAAPGTGSVTLDIRDEPFLTDHLVGGRPLLPTVMGIESMARAVALERPVSSLTDLRVGAPYFPPIQGAVQAHGGGIAEVTRRAVGLGTHCELASRESPQAPMTLHHSADFPSRQLLPRHRSRTVPRPRAGGPVVASETVYGLFFHGPSFRVVGTAYYADGLMVGVLAPDLPPAEFPRRPTVLAPLLIELCLQTAGLWALAVLHRMMIPDEMDGVTRFTDVEIDDRIPLIALVSPRRGADGRVSFDAQVVDADGLVHIAVTGYRTTDFAHPVDQAAAAAIQLALDGIPALQ